MHRLRYLFGILTLVATILGAFWIVRLVRQVDERPGVLLRVSFQDARGLRSGAAVRFRGVQAGVVREVAINDDGTRAIVHALLDPEVARHACLNTTFWIVVPRFAGLTAGATGLETLVRDPYLAFETPAVAGSPLAPDSLVNGNERPPEEGARSGLDEVGPGDLLMDVLLPENHGLRVGSPVTFRGMKTGEVRAVELAPEGTHVTARVRVERHHRQTVTDAARFWVARPQLSGALFTGFRIEDVSSLLAPFIAYYSPPGEGLPVESGFRAVASAERPDLEIADVPAAALKHSEGRGPSTQDDLVIVRVVYAATEEDTFSPDDPVRCEGSGLLYLDKAGRPVVITARSIVDGSYVVHDVFGLSADIVREQIKVVLPSGSVLHAGRVWVETGGADLAALVLTERPPELTGTPAGRVSFDEAAEPVDEVTLRRAGADGSGQPPVPVSAESPPGLAQHRGAAAVAADKVFGIYGRTIEDKEVPVVVPLTLVPMDLRP